MLIPIYLLLFPALANIQSPQLGKSKVLKYLVDISYVFFFAQYFTWHICKIILEPFGGIDKFGLGIKLPLALCVCFIIAVLLHELAEKPLTKMLKRKLIK